MSELDRDAGLTDRPPLPPTIQGLAAARTIQRARSERTALFEPPRDRAAIAKAEGAVPGSEAPAIACAATIANEP